MISQLKTGFKCRILFGAYSQHYLGCVSEIKEGAGERKEGSFRGQPGEGLAAGGGGAQLLARLGGGVVEGDVRDPVLGPCGTRLGRKNIDLREKKREHIPK